VLTNQFLETFITGSDPSVTNAPPPRSSVVIEAQVTNNPVTIPEYSVVRLEWTVFAVPKPVLSLSLSNSVQVLHGTGLTDVTYAVQSATNLPGPWATQGKVSATQTNFSFTNCGTAVAQFHRVAVP
jgi:hypothetical protein